MKSVVTGFFSAQVISHQLGINITHASEAAASTRRGRPSISHPIRCPSPASRGTGGSGSGRCHPQPRSDCGGGRIPGNPGSPEEDEANRIKTFRLNALAKARL